jgi:phosphopantothenoylcysteine decarboxylase/phosphopantothenate--cysteine ligase
VVVTAGGTREAIDPVRFIGNRSTGRMGAAIATAALDRGARVTVIAANIEVAVPREADIVEVVTTADLDAALRATTRSPDGSAGFDALVMAAAVADFRPKAVAEGKLKKEAGVPDLHLEPTPDIIGELGERKGTRILVGFAAETSDLAAAGEKKLRAKHLDLVVVNEVGREGTGFGSDTNVAMILSAEGPVEPLRTWTKAELATAICDRVAGLLARPSGSSP